MPFKTKNKKFKKSKKIVIFPKGLVRGFGKKLVNFPNFLKNKK